MLYKLRAHGYVKGERGRAERVYMVIPLHEALASLCLTKVTYRFLLLEHLSDKTLPECYFKNKVFVEHGHEGLVAPYALFLDAVPYSHDDSVMGIWAVCVITEERLLLAIIRSRSLCKCGCRGWCTMWEVHSWLAWSVQALSEGVYPSRRHDHLEFDSDDDAARAALSGTDIGMRFCLLYIKGDWSEFSKTFALPNWQDSLRPCIDCNTAPADMPRPEGSTIDALVWQDNSEASYFEACDRAEIVVTITREHHDAIRGLLQADKRKQGNHGLCFRADYAPLRLESGDRLEPSTALRDV